MRVPNELAMMSKLADLEGRQQVVERVGVVAAAGRFGAQIVAQQVAGGIPGYKSEAIGEGVELIAPMQRVGANAVQEHHWRKVNPPRFHVAEPIADIMIA